MVYHAKPGQTRRHLTAWAREVLRVLHGAGDAGATVPLLAQRVGAPATAVRALLVGELLAPGYVERTDREDAFRWVRDE